MKTQLESQYQLISTKNSELENLKFEILEKESTIRNMKDTIDKMRFEITQNMVDYEKSLEKYQILIKKTQATQKAQKLKKSNKSTSALIKEKDMLLDLIISEENELHDQKKNDFRDLFGKLKEIKKDSDFNFIEDYENLSDETEKESKIKKDFIFSDGNKEEKFIAEKYVIQERSNQKVGNKNKI